ncbi:MAG: hypothetical protein HYS15_01315 [Candidatus Spechtbacteria bacterium]|nr:hypothetical protein [Candidatus Spechtbacteria bacterium]
MELLKILSEIEKKAAAQDDTWGPRNLFGYEVTFTKMRGHEYNSYAAKITIPVFVVEKGPWVDGHHYPYGHAKKLHDLVGLGEGENFDKALLNAFKDILGALELAKRGL